MSQYSRHSSGFKSMKVKWTRQYPLARTTDRLTSWRPAHPSTGRGLPTHPTGRQSAGFQTRRRASRGGSPRPRSIRPLRRQEPQIQSRGDGQRTVLSGVPRTSERGGWQNKKGKGGGLTLEVGLDPVRRDRLGQDDDSPCGLPRDQDLGWCDIVRFGDRLDDLVLHLRGAGRTERRVGLDEDPVLL